MGWRLEGGWVLVVGFVSDVEERGGGGEGGGSGDLCNAVNFIVPDNSNCIRRLHTS